MRLRGDDAPDAEAVAVRRLGLGSDGRRGDFAPLDQRVDGGVEIRLLGPREPQEFITADRLPALGAQAVGDLEAQFLERVVRRMLPEQVDEALALPHREVPAPVHGVDAGDRVERIGRRRVQERAFVGVFSRAGVYGTADGVVRALEFRE